MNTELHVQRFRATHRVSDDAGRQLARDAQARLLDGELEAALEGVSGRDELVLLRRLSARVHISGRHSDGDNARLWSDALARSLQQALLHGDAQVLLRFASAQQALQAFAADALHGRDERDWAWQRLGLLPVLREHSREQRRQALLRVLADDAEQGVPLLRCLFFGNEWPALLAQLHPGELRGLTQAVLARRTGAAAAAFADDPGARTGHARREAGANDEAGATPARGAATPPHDSRPAPAWLHATLQAVPDPVHRRWALRLAALLDAPALARHGAPAVDAQLRAWLAPLGHDAAVFGPLPPADSPPEQPGHAHPAAATGASAKGAQATPAQDSTTAPGSALEAAAGEPHAPTATDARPATGAPAAHAVQAGASAREAAREERSGHTRLGGLLYLPPLLPLCGALLVLEDVALWPSLPQALHQLALALHRVALVPWPLAADDPAALAFCGLAPRQPPPADDVDLEIEPAREAAVQRAVASIHDLLSARLPDWRGPALLSRLLCREARISADPGWIDVHFALRDVSVDLRRAAIDLDPGFLPWLGVVLRYRYE